MSKRSYVTPEAKLYSLCAEERIAATCYGGQIYTFASNECHEMLKDGSGGANCYLIEAVQGS